MSRNSNQGSTQCKNHQFSLRPITKKRHLNKKIHASFCKILNKNQKLPKSKMADSGCSLFPIFNKDKNFATPAFILPNQKKYFLENRKNYLQDHARKVKDYQEITNGLYQPEPRSSHDHCNVCCESYFNYFQHINSQKHHMQIKQSRFNRYILQLQQQFIGSDSPAKSYKRSYEDRDIIQSDKDGQNLNNKNKKQRQSNQIQRQMIQGFCRKKIKQEDRILNQVVPQSYNNQPYSQNKSWISTIQPGSYVFENNYNSQNFNRNEFIPSYFQNFNPQLFYLPNNFNLISHLNTMPNSQYSYFNDQSNFAQGQKFMCNYENFNPNYLNKFTAFSQPQPHIQINNEEQPQMMVNCNEIQYQGLKNQQNELIYYSTIERQVEIFCKICQYQASPMPYGSLFLNSLSYIQAPFISSQKNLSFCDFNQMQKEYIYWNYITPTSFCNKNNECLFFNLANEQGSYNRYHYAYVI